MKGIGSFLVWGIMQREALHEDLQGGFSLGSE